ncbi:MAG TPA: hypothetical protein VGJ13_05000 [Pseudonocardiaceae bacterium]
MIDPSLVSTLATAGTVAVGYALGRISRPGARDKSGPQRPQAICGCDHNYGTHGGDGGKCNATVKRACQWEQLGYKVITTNWEYAPCPCLRYDGPVPLRDVLA